MPRRQTTFQFDGGAATFLGTALLAWMVSFVTLGLFFPYSVVLMMRWGAKHTTVQGRRLAFYGSAAALLGHWLLCGSSRSSRSASTASGWCPG
ncbi:MAG: DUF898 family protein [Acidimicrobiia bacterium]